MSKSGYWGGYIAHRYRDKAVAKKKPQPILKGNERKLALGSLMDILIDWRVNRFERESATVTGLRSSFCRAGYDWDRSDLEARTLVATIYTKLGYARPSWEEG